MEWYLCWLVHSSFAPQTITQLRDITLSQIHRLFSRQTKDTKPGFTGSDSSLVKVFATRESQLVRYFESIGEPTGRAKQHAAEQLSKEATTGPKLPSVVSNALKFAQERTFR